MTINDIETFLKYHARIKFRTERLFEYIPEDKMEWTYKEGKFTIGDIIRHLALIERYMYVENAYLKPSLYKGCDESYAKGFDKVINLYSSLKEESTSLLAALSKEDLNRKCTTPAGGQITTWKWLRAMLEHEIHHRGVLYTYLGILGVKTPPIFGLTEEEVASKGGE